MMMMVVMMTMMILMVPVRKIRMMVREDYDEDPLDVVGQGMTDTGVLAHLSVIFITNTLVITK